jgi:SAM-dependent methyltransferase
MATAAFKDYFSAKAAKYAASRPGYPRALIDFFADVAPGHDQALDCGCGNGQLSTQLARRFKRVIATDASTEQIVNAVPHESVVYRVAPAEQSGLPAGSVDLVTVAQAAHWLDLNAFYAEVRRVARATAIVALIAYDILRVEDVEANAAIQRFCYETMRPYWPPERRHVNDGYRSLPFPFAEIEAPQFVMEATWNMEDLLGYIETWSAVSTAERMAGREPIDRFRTELTRIWGPPTTKKSIRWPLSLKVGRVER